MNLLCFDIASGGISAALFDSRLRIKRLDESPWRLEAGGNDRATLSAEIILDGFRDSIARLNLHAGETIAAVGVGSFLHSCVILDDSGSALLPVFTWLDDRGESGLADIRDRLGDRFHEITGCRYHPMFPVFKLASLRLEDPELFGRVRRVASVKGLLLRRLTGAWVEDHGMASALGMFNVKKGQWDSDVLDILGLEETALPPIMSRNSVAGPVTPGAAAEFGLPAGVPVIVATGDGFLANIGSECESPSRLAVTLGTSAVVRQTLPRPVLHASAGTFCYKAENSAFLLGCAGSNGGNVLDWGRRIFGAAQLTALPGDPPVFIPLLHGERSPDWNPHVTGSWHGLTARHTGDDLLQSVLEGVVFNLAHFSEIVQNTSGEGATDAVLSGNGFLHPMAAPIFALVSGISTWIPEVPGIASLRGAAVCALRALAQPVPALKLERVQAFSDQKILRRYAEYRRLRERKMGQGGRAP